MTRFADVLDLAPSARDDDEGLFSRDIKGQLVRLDAPTEADYGKAVTIQIDGQPVTVPLAEPLKDAQGNVVLGLDGRTTPRYTTIYDAAAELFVKHPGDEAKIPIPILCHQPHMTPVAVCRVCVVQVYGQKRGKRAAERKLLPACQHQVKDGMEVFTMDAPGADGQRVRQAVTVLTELLTADHLKPAPPPAPAAELAPLNELQRLGDRIGLEQSRFGTDLMVSSAQAGGQSTQPGCRVMLDDSSPVFLVDRSACILCDRCSRACGEVKQNQIIGRTGKGPTAGIGFDLDDRIGDSGCVQCGECMVSCPTTAITFKPVAQVNLAASGKGAQGRSTVLSATELMADPLFAGVPPKFLLWQQGLAVRRPVTAGEVLCREGEPGNKAFVIRSGRLQVLSRSADARNKSSGGLFSGLTILGKSFGNAGRGKSGTSTVRAELTPADVILGEMACLSGSPRTADVVAAEDGEVWEIRRNILDRLMRSPSQRSRFENIYRGRALDVALRRSELFRDLPDDEFGRCVEFLRPRLSFVRVGPGQILFNQGDRADNLYLVRLGHVRIGVSRGGADVTIQFRGPGSVIGEIGMLAISPDDASKTIEAVDAALALALADAPNGRPPGLPAGKRSATCSALDPLELARVGRADFLLMVRTFPILRRRLVELSLARLRGDRNPRPEMREYVEQGLYQGQNLLLLDLTRCTRCDECTRACVGQHGTTSHGVPLPRLKRDGLHFGDFMVATSCRSCKDAYCMIGCPVDSIHRGRHQQIVIEDHCIGCGLCASNCPYGNIWMVPNEHRQMDTQDPSNPAHTVPVAQPKAATCDLCDAEGQMDVPVPRCVYACPHDAAHRMTGEELLNRVTR